MKKELGLIILFSILVFLSFGQEVKFYSKVDRNAASTDDNIHLTIVSNTDGNFELPDMKDFRVLAGPSRGSSSSVTIINGKYSQTSTYTWSLVIRPKKEGDLKIGSAVLRVDGKTFKTEEIMIKVKKGEHPVSDQSGNNYSTDKPIFCVISLNKSKVYQGEQIVATYKLYTRYNRILEYDLDIPIQNGFWSQEIDPGKKGWGSYVESVNGVDYAVAVLKKEVLYPNTFGKLKLKPYELMVVVQESFWNSKRFDLVANSPSVDVMALPTAKSNSFTGAVGKFEIEAAINQTEVKANDAIDLTIRLKGNGNFKLMENPNLDLARELEVFDPEIKDKLSVTESGTSGSREYKYLIIPRRGGDYTIGPVQFEYFDIEKKKMETLTAGPFEIHVEKGLHEVQATGADPEEVEVLEKDIRHIYSFKNDIVSSGQQKWNTPIFLFSLGAGPIAFLLLLFFTRKKEKSEEETLEDLSRKAGKMVQKYLKAAFQAEQSGKIDLFYEELHRGLTYYISNKLRIPVADLSRARIREELETRNAETSQITAILSILEACEMARYASSAAGDPKEWLNESEKVLNDLEKQLK